LFSQVKRPPARHSLSASSIASFLDFLEKTIAAFSLLELVAVTRYESGF